MVYVLFVNKVCNHSKQANNMNWFGILSMRSIRRYNWIRIGWMSLECKRQFIPSTIWFYSIDILISETNSIQSDLSTTFGVYWKWNRSYWVRSRNFCDTKIYIVQAQGEYRCILCILNHLHLHRNIDGAVLCLCKGCSCHKNQRSSYFAKASLLLSVCWLFFLFLLRFACSRWITDEY